jgi:choice-of-anchor B domain-containing protein
VIDLTQLRDVAVPTFANDIAITAEYDEFGGAHNVWINEDTGRAYGVGTDTAEGGLHIVDISDPTSPTKIGEFATDGYTHDVECVVYTGPDTDYNGDYEGPDMDGDATNGSQAELCFAANEDSMTVVDVSDPTATSQVAKIKYNGSAYTHQSVLTEDMQWLMWNDELDEGTTGPGTRTFWADVSDLDLKVWQDDFVNPKINDNVFVYTHDLLTVDHNMYITGDILWQANYNGGLQIFRISDEELAKGNMERIGFFDVDPGLNIGQYGGAWNVFTGFGQDKIIVSTLDEGLYVLQTDFEVGES